MEKRNLGKSGLKVSALGFGCMGLSSAYGPPAERQDGIRIIQAAFERGVTLFDTAEAYGPFKNEELVGEALAPFRQDVVIATKFGFGINPDGTRYGLDSRPDHIRQVTDAALTRLKVEAIDLLYQHRVDPNVPIEETVGAMSELVTAGKVRALGLSEASPETLRRAAKVHPIAALQSEYSLWSREVSANGVLATCRELGIGFVPYSPLGRGFLTGAIQKVSDLDPTDWRRTNPRFAEEALQNNLKLADAVKELAGKKGCTPGQFALAWVLAQGNDVIPIPGTKRVRYLEENMQALAVQLTESDLQETDARFRQFAVTGERYSPEMMALVPR